LLGLDADTEPEPDLAAAVVYTAESRGLGALSCAPRFAAQSPLERWVQPALLAGLIYRGAPGGEGRAARHTLANGQCFLVKRDVLQRTGGFAPVSPSFAEDVSLVRRLARHDVPVSFVDGSAWYRVRSYASARDMWHGWGRSIDLKDASTPLVQGIDVAMLVGVQLLPVPIVVGAIGGALWAPTALLVLNAFVLLVRALLNVAMRRNYERTGVPFWLSPLADPLAAVRVCWSALRRPRAWRGRAYATPSP
jgi:dolichol-phosphate mannosyltransferase